MRKQSQTACSEMAGTTGGGSLRHVRASERARDATGGPSRSAAITRLERELKVYI